MLKKEMSGFCRRKLDMQLVNGRHEHYHPVYEGNLIELFNVVAVSRGTGEIDLKNMKGIAIVLGLSIRELEEAEQCNYGKVAIYICMCVQIIRKAFYIISADPIVHRWDHSTLNLISSLIHIIKLSEGKKKGRKDSVLLIDRLAQLEEMSISSEGRLLELESELAEAIKSIIT